MSTPEEKTVALLDGNRDATRRALGIAAELLTELKTIGETQEERERTLAYIRAKGLKPSDIYIALIDTFGPPVEEASK